jgi:hypothetical protein
MTVLFFNATAWKVPVVKYFCGIDQPATYYRKMNASKKGSATLP